MSVFDRFRRGSGADDAAAEASSAEPEPGAFDDEVVDEIGVHPLSTEDVLRLDALRARYAGFGINPADITTIQRAFDDALARQEGGEEATDVVEVVGAAIGDHLVERAAYRWVMVVDPFGVDLAVEPPRRGVPVVTQTLVAVRWMKREAGTLAGVVDHLASIS